MPATKSTSPWQTLSVHPLIGTLDVRSRPAEIVPGGFRWKVNLETTQEGKMCRRGGFSKAFSEVLPGGNYPNSDFHHQGGTREPITLQYEQTKSDGSRMLVIGTKSRVAVLDETTGTYTTVLSGLGGTASVFRAASLSDFVLFANGVDEIAAMADGGLGVTMPIPELTHVGGTDHYKAAKVIIQFQSIILLMNVKLSTSGGPWTDHPERIIWSDINGPLTWDPLSHMTPGPGSVTTTLCGYQDLDYGDEILAAAELMNAVYIFTRRAIWRMSVSSDATRVFDFVKVYAEPKNQTGCLVYPYTLASDGQTLHYLGRESVYHYNPYMAAPECESDQWDWFHKAAGVIYTKADTRLDGTACNAPCAEYVPEKKELWISWPSDTSLVDANSGAVNNWTLVAAMTRRTADIVDHGFTSYVNYRSLPAGAGLCNEEQRLLAASGEDYCIKEVGGVFHREMAPLGADVTDDLDLVIPITGWLTVGYNSEMRGEIPAGLFDRPKRIRKAFIDIDVSEQNPPPCIIQAFIGNSQQLQDPNDLDNICSVLWQDIGTKQLQCQDGYGISELKARNLRPANDFTWPCYWEGIHLYFKFIISNPRAADGSYPKAIGADVCFARIDFDVLPLPKP